MTRYTERQVVRWLHEQTAELSPSRDDLELALEALMLATDLAEQLAGHRAGPQREVAALRAVIRSLQRSSPTPPIT